MLSLHSISSDENLLQRAHLVLTWLTHFYIHSIPVTESLHDLHILESLAIPLVKVSTLLETAPVLTYADTVDRIAR